MLFFAYLTIYFIVFLFGSSIGSFLNVIIYRVPNKIPIWKGRSFCPNCRAVIKPYDMIPIASFFLLRAKCRSCKAAISMRYPLVELITGLTALFIYLRFDFTAEAFLYFAAAAGFIAISFIDLDTMTIPDGLVIYIAVIAAACAFFVPSADIVTRIIGFFAVSFPMFLLTILIPDCFGGGDIKLSAVCGFLLGWKLLLLAMFIALIAGGVHGAILIMKNRSNLKKHFAFGQYICLGAVMAIIWGDLIINCYLGLFGL